MTDYAKQALDVTLESLTDRADELTEVLFFADHPFVVGKLCEELRRTNNAVQCLQSLEVQADAPVFELSSDDLEIIG